MVIQADNEGQRFILGLADVARKYVAFNDLPVMLQVLSQVTDIPKEAAEKTPDEVEPTV